MRRWPGPTKLTAAHRSPIISPMNVVGPATEAEMVLAFVRGELDSPKYRADYGWEIQSRGGDRGSLADHGDGASRAKVVLKARRGYPDSALFTGFPTDVRWQRVLLHAEDAAKLYCVRDCGWRDLTQSTYRLEDAARNLERIEVADINVHVREIVDKLARGARPQDFGELLGVRDGDRIVLFEGTKRATAYLVAGQLVDVPAIIGDSLGLDAWRLLPP